MMPRPFIDVFCCLVASAGIVSAAPAGPTGPPMMAMIGEGDAAQDATSIAARPAGTRAWPVSLMSASGRLDPANVIRLSVGAGAGEITFADASGTRSTRPIKGMFAIAPRWWTDSQSSPAPSASRTIGDSVLELVDGQRLIGVPVDRSTGSPAADDVLMWRTERFGTLTIPLEKVARWSRSGAPAPRSVPATSDRLFLANGDVLEGLVERLETTVVLAPASGGKNTAGNRVPLDNLDEIRFANPAAQAAGTVAWMADGSVVALREISSESDGGRLRVRSALSPAGAEVCYFVPSEILGIVLDAGSMHALAAMTFSGVKPMGDRPGTRPPNVEEPLDQRPAVLGLGDVRLPGPMTFEVTLPKGALAVAGLAELPEDAWTWGECELVFSMPLGDGERELARVRLSAERPSMPISIPLDPKDGPRLRVRLEPGALGPIQDHVIIRRGVITTALSAP